MALSTNKQLDNILSFIKKTWGIEVAPDRVAGWEQELADGSGRDIKSLRKDIFKNIVTDEKVDQYVQSQFDTRNIDPATSGETAIDRINRISDELQAGDRRFSELGTTLDKFGTATTDVGADTVQPQAQTDTTSGVMPGGVIHKVDNPGQDDYYIITYEYPPGSGNQFFYRFDSLATLEESVGPNLGGGSVEVGPTVPESQLSDWVDAGDSNEISGVTGSFDEYMNDIVRGVAERAGIGDPSRVSDALRDPEMQTVMAKIAAGKLNAAQSKALIRKTDYYKNVAYPGIENFYAGSDNPEQAYDTYLRNIANTSKKLGIPPGPDGTYRDTAGKMLDAKVSDVAYASFQPIFQRAQANAGYADALNKWTEKYAGKTINNFEDWFDVLAGTAPAEINQIAEAAGLQYLADNAGFDITDTQLRTIADTVNLTEAQASQVFSNTARSLLSLGERGLRRGDLTAQDVLNAEAGFGDNIDKIKLKVQKLATEEGLVDDPSAKYFTDYNAKGSPIKSGLRSGLQEGA